MLSSFPVFCIPHADLFYPPFGILRSERTVIYLFLFYCRTREFHPLVASL